ncbi:MAG: ABC transporter permease subunit [Clostridiaceae bacterium]
MKKTILKERSSLLAYAENKKTFLIYRDIPIYFLILPSFILILIFSYIPMYGAVIAFKDFSPGLGILKSKWVGLEHFSTFINDPYFWTVVKNTLKINILSLIFGFPAPIILALLLNEMGCVKFKKIVQTVTYLPYFISWVVVASIIYTITSPESGLINVVITHLGYEPIYFMGEVKYFVPIVIISGIWKGVGMNSIYYIAAISSIDQQLYEAACLEGCGRIRQTIHITLPGLRNIISVMLVLQLGSLASIGFDNIFLLQNSLIYRASDVISTYTYRLGLVDMEYSITTAIGLVQSIINFIMIITSNKLVAKISGWSLW